MKTEENSTEKNSPDSSMSARDDAAGKERRMKLLEIVRRNLAVGRESLRDSQFSPDARLIHFYEAVALSLTEDAQTDSHTQDEVEQHLEQAVELLDLEEEQGEMSAELVLGSLAQCNLATLFQRRGVVCVNLKDCIDAVLVKDAKDHVTRSIELYEKIIERYERHQKKLRQVEQLRGQYYTAQFGRFVSRYALNKHTEEEHKKLLSLIGDELEQLKNKETEDAKFSESILKQMKKMLLQLPRLKAAAEGAPPTQGK